MHEAICRKDGLPHHRENSNSLAGVDVDVDDVAKDEKATLRRHYPLQESAFAGGDPDQPTLLVEVICGVCGALS